MLLHILFYKNCICMCNVSCILHIVSHTILLKSAVYHVYSQIFRWHAYCSTYCFIKVVCSVPCMFVRYANCILCHVLFYKNGTQYIMHIKKY